MTQIIHWSRPALHLFLAFIFLVLPAITLHAHPSQDDVEAASAKTWVGKTAKGFVLPGLDGKPVDISKKLGKSPIVLVFYRGVW